MVAGSESARLRSEPRPTCSNQLEPITRYYCTYNETPKPTKCEPSKGKCMLMAYYYRDLHILINICIRTSWVITSLPIAGRPPVKPHIYTESGWYLVDTCNPSPYLGSNGGGSEPLHVVEDLSEGAVPHITKIFRVGKNLCITF